MRSDQLFLDLASYSPADAVEAEHVAAVKELVARGDATLARSHFAPGHITASAFIVDPVALQILLHHHRRLGRWLQMGGHVDQGESPLNAALREAREESGLRTLTPLVSEPFDIDVHVIPEAKGEPQHLHFDIRFLFAASRLDDVTLAEEESVDLAWLDFDEAEARMNEEASTRALGKIRRHLTTLASRQGLDPSLPSAPR